MFDVIDRFRHWLIKKLACGDMILLNFEMAPDRRIRQRNAGPSLISGSEFAFNDTVKAAVGISRDGPFDGYGLALQSPIGLTVSDNMFRGVR